MKTRKIIRLFLFLVGLASPLLIGWLLARAASCEPCYYGHYGPDRIVCPLSDVCDRKAADFLRWTPRLGLIGALAWLGFFIKQIKQKMLSFKISHFLRFLAMVLLLIAASFVVGFILQYIQYQGYKDELCRIKNGPPSFCGVVVVPPPDSRLITWGIGLASIDILAWLGYFWVRRKVKKHA